MRIDVVLTNTSSSYYASSYSLKLGFKNMEHIRASDPEGAITPIITKEDDGFVVEVPFNARVVGVDKSLPFAIEFDTSDVAQHLGNVWEVNIPGIANQEEFTDFTVRLLVPQSFGAPVYTKPKGKNSLLFTKEQLGTSGISVGFGSNQIYVFDLTYHLKNDHVFPITTEIALVPSTNYQEVSFSNIIPRPKNVIQDNDGNWLAQYRLSPAEKKDIHVQGNVQITLRPRREILSDKDRKRYLKESEHWQVNDKEIMTLAKKLKTPRAIYNYTVNTLTYDFSRVEQKKERLGAVSALQKPSSAVCLEFTDLFISVARAAGIPAREVDGYAFTQNAAQRPLSLLSDILHAWPEYYDDEKQTWIMVDPTWGNTTGGVDYFETLDFDHIAFVIRGQDSTYPVPAGGYKLEADESRKDVDVRFSSSFDAVDPLLNASIELPNKALSGVPIHGNIRLQNTTGSVFPKSSLLIGSSDLLPSIFEVQTDAILPYATVDIPIAFQALPLLTRKDATINVQLGKTLMSKQIHITPVIISDYKITGGVFIGSIALVTLIIAKRSGRLPFFR